MAAMDLKQSRLVADVATCFDYLAAVSEGNSAHAIAIFKSEMNLRSIAMLLPTIAASSIEFANAQETWIELAEQLQLGPLALAQIKRAQNSDYAGMLISVSKLAVAEDLDSIAGFIEDLTEFCLVLTESGAEQYGTDPMLLIQSMRKVALSKAGSSLLSAIMDDDSEPAS